jgi:hypothetical protein
VILLGFIKGVTPFPIQSLCLSGRRSQWVGKQETKYQFKLYYLKIALKLFKEAFMEIT